MVSSINEKTSPKYKNLRPYPGMENQSLHPTSNIRDYLPL